MLTQCGGHVEYFTLQSSLADRALLNMVARATDVSSETSSDTTHAMLKHLRYMRRAVGNTLVTAAKVSSYSLLGSRRVDTHGSPQIYTRKRGGETNVGLRDASCRIKEAEFSEQLLLTNNLWFGNQYSVRGVGPIGRMSQWCLSIVVPTLLCNFVMQVQ